MNIRTRSAPSPTGFVHIGFIHNAMFAHALAKHNNGKFILRIEDTDQKRFVEGAAEEIYKMMDEFGLTPDEGPVQGGPYKPYIQSERMKSGVYLKAAEQLVKKGHAYYCFLTSKELAELKSQDKERKAFRSIYRDVDTSKALERIKKGEQYVIRLKVPENEKIVVDDAILGRVEWDSNDIDDQVLIKSDGFPTYHLGVVVDDNAMKITHITRSYEWLPSTPKQILLYKYIGFTSPVFAHGSLVLDPDGGKLSKRKGNVSARQFLVEGYLPEAILNFLMFLGWAPPIERKHGEKEREIFSHKEFIKLYDLKDRQKTNAVFDRTKLLWFNQQYISHKTPEDLSAILIKWLKNYSEDKTFNERIEEDHKAGKLKFKLILVNERAKTLVELLDMLKFFYVQPKKVDLDIKQLKKVKPVLKELFNDVYSLIEQLENDEKSWTNEKWASSMKALAEKYDLKTGDPFMLLRVAITGGPFSPPLFESLQLLGKDEVLMRIKEAMK